MSFTAAYTSFLYAYPFLWLLSTTLLTAEGRVGSRPCLSFCQGEQGPLRKPGVSLLGAPERIQPGETQAQRGVGSKTEGPQTELLENRKVSLSAPQPNFLYFLTSFSNFGLASWKNVRDGGGESM